MVQGREPGSQGGRLRRQPFAKCLGLPQYGNGRLRLLVRRIAIALEDAADYDAEFGFDRLFRGIPLATAN